MFEFHTDRKRYFGMQIENTVQYVIPFIEEAYPLQAGMQVLEIGCGEGGVLKAFIDKGCKGVGVELDEPRVVNAKEWLKDDIAAGKMSFITRDIYGVDAAKEFDTLFDIVILKDVIEHIHDQQKLIAWMKTFLKPEGVIFFGFPPWQMPFGGHQQMCTGKLLSKLPYYHLLPRPIYKALLKAAQEPWEALLEIKDTGISIERFEKLTKAAGYRTINKRHYLLNPIYRYKFGWKPKKQSRVIAVLPWVRNFFTTCVYYLIQPQSSSK